MSKLIDYINNNISFEEEYQRIFGKKLGHSKVFCPFHENVNTPAAKFYPQINALKCFAENRVFHTYDLLSKFDRNRINEIKTSVILDVSDNNFNGYNDVIEIKQFDRNSSILTILATILS